MQRFVASSLTRTVVPLHRAPLFTPVTLRSLCTVQTFLDKAEVEDRVMGVLRNFSKIEASKLSSTASFSSLGLDSLDQVEVCMALEEEFCITIPDAESEKILSTEDAISFIATHPQAK